MRRRVWIGVIAGLAILGELLLAIITTTNVVKRGNDPHPLALAFFSFWVIMFVCRGFFLKPEFFGGGSVARRVFLSWITWIVEATYIPTVVALAEHGSGRLFPQPIDGCVTIVIGGMEAPVCVMALISVVGAFGAMRRKRDNTAVV